MINIEEYRIFQDNVSTLKELSYDKSENEYMTDSEKEAINFDKVKDEYIQSLKLSDPPKSNDAILENGKDEIVFIEFKNGYIGKPYELRKKIYDSILIFSDITSLGISELRKNSEYILVYNEQKNMNNNDENLSEKMKSGLQIQNSKSYNKIVADITGFANKEIVRFRLDIFENYCFKKVHTYTEQEFEKYLSDLL